jgi:hypothetical protein
MSYHASYGGEVYSDRESDTDTGVLLNQFSKSMPSMSAGSLRRPRRVFSSSHQTDGLLTDEEPLLEDETKGESREYREWNETHHSADEFSKEQLNNARVAALRGRQRKRLAARTVRGSEFRQHRKKRRVYFCCVSGEIDISKVGRVCIVHMYAPIHL